MKSLVSWMWKGVVQAGCLVAYALVVAVSMMLTGFGAHLIWGCILTGWNWIS